MKLSELLQGVAVAPYTLSDDTQITSITCDSRKVEAGALFVCICGTAGDGHDFAASALEKGAVAILAERDLKLPQQIITPATRAAWATLSANWFGHPARHLHLVGVTGTNGKTTTVCLLKSILEAAGHKVGLIGTIQNMIGDRAVPAARTTPDTYELQSLFALMVAEGCDYCVMEVSSHALHQERVGGCTFDVGVFSNLTQDHLDYHGTMEEYMLAKRKLFSMSKHAVINFDDPWGARMAENIPCPLSYYSAKNDSADFVARNIMHKPDGVRFELIGSDRIERVHLHIPGQFSVYNGLAAAAAAITLGVPFETVTEALYNAAGVKGRAEIVPTNRDFTVVIDYAHTPDGLENICRTMKDCCAGRLLTIFGCGGDRDRTKRPLMGEIAARFSDVVIVTSDNPRTEDPTAIIEEILVGLQGSKTPVKVIENRVDAIHWAIKHAKPGDTVLLAGKGHETYQILKDGTIHLDEREVVAEALQTL